MWKNRLNRILNIIMGSVVGVFIGYGLYSVWDYKTHPGLYAMQSAPWDTSFDNNIAANAYGMHWGKYVSFKF